MPPGVAPGPPPPPGADLVPSQDDTGVWPLDPRPSVVEGFHPPRSAYGAGHRGVDLAGLPGQRVRSALAGRVTFAGSLAGRGVVVVSHGATRTTYEPVRASAHLGAHVAAGEPLGALQAAGSHCAPATCLHWGLIEGDTYLDPLTLVGAGQVRLLPFLLGTPAVAAASRGLPLALPVDPVVPAAHAQPGPTPERGGTAGNRGHAPYQARGWAWR